MQHLAIDFGASSGRHILGTISADGKLETKEIHRFKNSFAQKGSFRVWDIERLFAEICEGLRKCAEANIIPDTVGIDTWGVDYLLLDGNDSLIGDAISYWDARTEGIPERVFSDFIPESDYYRRTGTQILQFNTIFQLMAEKLNYGKNLEASHSLLMMPDYMNFLLTGVKASEYTIASTSGLLNAQGNWDRGLIDILGLPQHIFGELIKPGTRLGRLSPEISRRVGFDCDVIAVASHDTASAVVSVPFLDPDAAFISSGTWSLLGKETLSVDTSDICHQQRFTNEGGYGNRIRFLTNIMGMWMIESIMRELPEKMPYDTLDEMAENSSSDAIVNCLDLSLFAPASMIEAIRNLCVESDQQPPESAGDLARVAYRSLAKMYASRLEGLESLTGKSCSALHIVGGGSRSVYLNQLSATETGKHVFTGPAEATSIGNIMVQMIESSVLKDLSAARDLIRNTFEIKEFKP